MIIRIFIMAMLSTSLEATIDITRTDKLTSLDVPMQSGGKIRLTDAWHRWQID